MACFAGCFEAAAHLATRAGEPQVAQCLSADPEALEMRTKSTLSCTSVKEDDATSDTNSTTPPESCTDTASDTNATTSTADERGRWLAEPVWKAPETEVAEGPPEPVCMVVEATPPALSTAVRCPHCTQSYTGESAQRALDLHLKYLHPVEDKGLNVGYELVYDFKAHKGVTGDAQRYALQGGVSEK